MAGREMLLLAAMISKGQLAELLMQDLKAWMEIPDESVTEKDEQWLSIELNCSLLLAKAIAPTIEEALTKGLELDERMQSMRTTDGSMPMSLPDTEVN